MQHQLVSLFLAVFLRYCLFFCKILPLLGPSFPCEDGDILHEQSQTCSNGQHMLFDGSPMLEPVPVLEAAPAAGRSPGALEPWGGGPRGQEQAQFASLFLRGVEV